MTGAPVTTAPIDPALLTDRGPCPLCGNDDANAFDIVHDFDRIPVRRCQSCHFVHSARVMTAEGMKRYYADTFGSDRHRLGQQVNAGISHRALRSLLDLSNIKTVLDVGTGYGFLPALLRDRYGMDVTGVELSAQEADYAEQTNNVAIHRQPLGEADIPRDRFDLVMSYEVIEHVPDPVEFTRQMANHVRPGGWLVICTDNFEAGVVRRLGPQFPKWIPHSHISHFAPDSLRRCIQMADGLTYERGVSYTTWELVVRAGLTGHRQRDVRACYNLDDVMATEMKRGYPMFGVRRVINALWFAVTHRRDLNGALMYALARKPDTQASPTA